VLSRHDSRAAPQTVQTASPVCGTKNFSSVRLYSAPQLHCTIVAITGICASDHRFSRPELCHNRTDPLPTRQRFQTKNHLRKLVPRELGLIRSRTGLRPAPQTAEEETAELVRRHQLIRPDRRYRRVIGRLNSCVTMLPFDCEVQMNPPSVDPMLSRLIMSPGRLAGLFWLRGGCREACRCRRTVISQEVLEGL